MYEPKYVHVSKPEMDEKSKLRNQRFRKMNNKIKY